jgi:hypothetical protein
MRSKPNGCMLLYLSIISEGITKDYHKYIVAVSEREVS